MHILLTKLFSLQGDPEIASVVVYKHSGTRDWDGVLIAGVSALASLVQDLCFSKGWDYAPHSQVLPAPLME